MGHLRILFLAVALLVVAFLVVAASARANAVGIWLLDEGAGTVASDSSGNGNDGEIVDGTWDAGRVGGALRFNDESTVVNIPNSDSLNVVGDLSVVAWLNAEPTVTWACVLSKGPDSTP